MKVLFAAAEYQPLATVGGLAAAASGLVSELRRQGTDVELVLPDYGGIELDAQSERTLDVPDWVAPATVRTGTHDAAGTVHLVAVPGIKRPHPYLQEDGQGWADNDARFLRFSRAVAALWDVLDLDVLHLNDWHTAAALAALDATTPTVLSIHNLAYQGITAGGWLQLIGARNHAYEWFGQCNPFLGGLALADQIVAVSPNYAQEIREPEHGFGLDALLAHRAALVNGILNGIDTQVWDPSTDSHLRVTYNGKRSSLLEGKAAARTAVRERFGFPSAATPRPLTIMVTRLTDQKGVDVLVPLAPHLDRLGTDIAILGSGETALAEQIRAVEETTDAVRFIDGYDEALSHLMFAAGDFLLMPSRFEPCGLTQMQALRYGTLPIATAVGGLVDTVIDLDDHPESGNGWLADGADPLAVLDALHRAVRSWATDDGDSLNAVRQRAMSVDWSWEEPARAHQQIYSQVLA